MTLIHRHVCLSTALCLGLLACNDSNKPDLVELEVVTTEIAQQIAPDGTVTATVELRMTDSDGTPIGGVWFASVSHGQLIGVTGPANAGGEFTIHWTITAAERAGSTAPLQLRVCAQTYVPEECIEHVVATLVIPTAG